jgi:hypothetical protein
LLGTLRALRRSAARRAFRKRQFVTSSAGYDQNDNDHYDNGDTPGNPCGFTKRSLQTAAPKDADYLCVETRKLTRGLTFGNLYFLHLRILLVSLHFLRTLQVDESWKAGVMQG